MSIPTWFQWPGVCASAEAGQYQRPVGSRRLRKPKTGWVLQHINGLCKGISPQNMALNGTVPPFSDPEIPIEHGVCLIRQ